MTPLVVLCPRALQIIYQTPYLCWSENICIEGTRDFYNKVCFVTDIYKFVCMRINGVVESNIAFAFNIAVYYQQNLDCTRWWENIEKNHISWHSSYKETVDYLYCRTRARDLLYFLLSLKGISLLYKIWNKIESPTGQVWVNKATIKHNA